MEAFAIGGLLVLALAIVLTYRTRLWWLPGLAVLVTAGCLVAIVVREPTARDDYGTQGIGDFFVLLAAGGGGLVGALLLVFTGSARRFNRTA